MWLLLISMSNTILYPIHRISRRYLLNVIQDYAPTSTHSDDEVESMNKDIYKAIRSCKTHYTIGMGYFNAKFGKRCSDELRVGVRIWTKER